jgi:uncharacterized protein (TIGR02186 family)
MVVRRKSRVAGIWLNTRQVTFDDVPSFYSIASTRPLDEVAPAPLRQLHELGVEYLHIVAADKRPSAAQIEEFRSALIWQKQSEGLYPTSLGKVNFLGESLFRSTLSFPATVPTGTYLVQVFLIRDKDVISGQTTPLVISKVGVGAEVTDFADRRAALYGIVAVLIAGFAGWLANFIFRKVS